MAVSVLASYVWLLGADNPDPVPDAENVTAGWLAGLVFAFLIVAVVFLARSLVKQLRKAQAAREAGVYGDEPTEPPAAATPKTPGAAAP
jgi:hypothetical protein